MTRQCASTCRGSGEPRGGVFPGKTPELGREISEPVTNAFRGRGIQGGTWTALGFPISTAHKLRAVCRFEHRPRFVDTASHEYAIGSGRPFRPSQNLVIGQRHFNIPDGAGFPVRGRSRQPSTRRRHYGSASERQRTPLECASAQRHVRRVQTGCHCHAFGQEIEPQIGTDKSVFPLDP